MDFHYLYCICSLIFDREVLEEPFIILPELFIKAADAIISYQEKQIFKLFY